MSVGALLQELRRLDVNVWSDGDQLRCNAPAGVLTPALRDELRARKADIVAFLRSAEAAARQPRAIVPLQPRGGSPPVFAVGGHNGDVFCYRRLADQLGEDQPFYGLQPPGLDGEREPLTSVEDLASYFAAEIRSFHPTGKIIIAGYCAGGAIAFELARHLTAGGSLVAFVALFAGRYPTWFRRLPQARQRILYYADRIHTHARVLGSLSNGSRWRYGRELLGRVTLRPPAPMAETNDPALILRDKVQRATMLAVCRYKPAFFAGRLVMFLPSPKARRSSEGLLRWRSLAKHVEEYCGPHGCEGDAMLLEPCVPAIAELFRRASR